MLSKQEALTCKPASALTWEKQQLSMRVSVLASYGCATNVPRCWGGKKRKDIYYLTKLLWVRKPAWLCPLALHHDVGMWQSSEGLLNQSWKSHFQYGSHDWKSQVSLWQKVLSTAQLRCPQKWQPVSPSGPPEEGREEATMSSYLGPEAIVYRRFYNANWLPARPYVLWDSIVSTILLQWLWSFLKTRNRSQSGTILELATTVGQSWTKITMDKANVEEK